jgi:hypothetical protein
MIMLMELTFKWKILNYIVKQRNLIDKVRFFLYIFKINGYSKV